MNDEKKCFTKDCALHAEMIVRTKYGLKYDPEYAVSEQHMVSDCQSIIEKNSNALNYDEKLKKIFFKYSDFECWKNYDIADAFCKDLKKAL